MKDEPVLIMGVIASIVTLAVGMGFLDQGTGDLLLNLAASAVTLGLALYARSKVTPVVKK
jgi:hypothetical protein